ncbi:MAG: ABC transporter substrate-binding protein [Dehalococcoidales bacterium]
MKKLIFLSIALIIIIGMLLTGCGQAQTTTTSATTPSASPTTTGKQPVSGGILRIIASSGPQMLSYVPVMGPGDRSVIFPAAEALVDTTTDRGGFSTGVEPVLAESVDVDTAALTITFHIRQGVKFSDGSELTAEVAQWNMQQVIDAGAMPYMSYFKGFRTPDKYTLIIDMTSFNNQMMPTWGWWTAMYSKAAWDAASGGDLAKGKEWARTHIVGTGPFILKDFQRDVSLTWVKNPNYWRKDKPYLNEIDVKIIPDAVTARAAFEAGEADVWGAPAKDAQELIAKGYFEQTGWPMLPWGIWPNTANPDSKMNDKNLRAAVEYAIDKDGIAKAIGHGLFKSLKSLPPPGEWAADPNAGRSYDPQKAKDLLAAAGYSTSKPCKVKLLTTNAFGPDPIDACTMVKQQLDAVGFDVTIDVADAGRYFGTAYGKTNVPAADTDMLWYFAGGEDTNYLQTYIRWFSINPFTWISFLGRTAEQENLDKQAMAVVTVQEQIDWCGKVMKYMTDNALIIPVYGSVAYVIQQPWVHSTEYTQGFVRWQTEEVWMEKH